MTIGVQLKIKLENEVEKKKVSEKTILLCCFVKKRNKEKEKIKCDITSK